MIPGTRYLVCNFTPSLLPLLHRVVILIVDSQQQTKQQDPPPLVSLAFLSFRNAQFLHGIGLNGRFIYFFHRIAGSSSPPPLVSPAFLSFRSALWWFPSCTMSWWLLTLLEPQSRFGDKILGIWLVCPQNGTAVLKGLRHTFHHSPIYWHHPLAGSGSMVLIVTASRLPLIRPVHTAVPAPSPNLWYLPDESSTPLHYYGGYGGPCYIGPTVHPKTYMYRYVFTMYMVLFTRDPRNTTATAVTFF